MALNLEQKRILDEVILDYIKTHKDTWTYFRDLREVGENALHITLSAPAISASLNRIMAVGDGLHYHRKEDKGIAYRFLYYDFAPLREINKNKNILTFVFGNNKNLHYDFQSNQYLEEIVPSLENMEEYLYFNTIERLLPYEWLFNYMTDIKELFYTAQEDKNVYEKMPKGLVNYLKENEINHLTLKTLRDYYRSITYTPNEMRFIDRFDAETLTRVNKVIGLNNLNKMLIASVKSYELDYLKNSIHNLINLVNNAEGTECADLLDTNRSIAHNVKIVQEYCDKKKDEILENKLKKLNFINGLVFDDYIVVVPQTVKDKIEEGKMQNNCVGYYYDNSIRKGENLIYFLRKVETPNQSLVTCRYNVSDKETVEARRVNNSSCKDADWTVINKIDDIIKENLK